jgi:ATP/maltotriose-dependent transcriptional regulator MalT/DNA-binding SARP family transcriptional activator
MAEKGKTSRGRVAARRPAAGAAGKASAPQSGTLAVPFLAKVRLPERRPAIVRRERLAQALGEASKNRIAIVSAPAGYGKTTLLQDFVQAGDAHACWYGLDERDREMDTFLRYFVASGQQAFPGFGQELVKALGSGGPATPEEASELMVQACGEPQEEYLFVIDDFHHLDVATEQTRKAVEGWLYRLPQGCHVIVGSRTRPQFGILPMMTVRQEVSSLYASDFEFSCDEVVQLFREVLGREISLDDAQHLADVTEGWAGALILLADRVQSAGSVDLEQLNHTDTLFQYISLEQFDPLPAEVKEFLLSSAVLRTMDVESVNELLERSDAQERLTQLRNLNLVLVEEEDGGTRYRYHGLLRAFLVSHVRSSDGEQFRELNMLAAQRMESDERWEDAVYHYIQAGAWDNVVEVTEEVGWRMFEEGKLDTLADWLSSVPAEEMTSQPQLMLWKGRVLHYLNQLDAALALVSRAIALLEEKEDWVPLAEALVTRGMSLRVKGDYLESRDALQRACKLLSEHEAPQETITEARKELGITLSRCGDLKDAVQELSAVVDIYESQGDVYNIAYTCNDLGSSLGLMGRLPEAAGYLERSRQLCTQLGNDHMLVQALINLGMVYYLQGDFERAREIYSQGLERVRLINNLNEEVYLSVSLADIQREVGEFKAALDSYNEVLDDAWTVGDAYICVYIMDAIANTHRLMGDLVQAESWAGRASAEAEKTEGDLEQGICLVTKGLIQRQQGELKEAVEYFEKAVPYLREKDARRELAATYFHAAGAYFSLKKKRVALEYLEKVAELVKGLGYDHFLLVEAARNPLLVQYGAANKAADGYYARMKKLMKGAAAGAEAESEDGVATDDATLTGFGFGHARVEYNGQEVTDLEWRSEKSREMFFFFLCNRRGLRKEEIVTALWPDMPEEKTTSAFHSSMYRLRKALYKDIISKESGRYQLDPNGSFAFDVEQFQAALAAAAGSQANDEALKHMERAESLYKGQFAPEFYSEWAETLRWQLEEQHMSLLGSLSAAYNEAGEFKKSADICQKIIELDEFNEAAWYRLMSNYMQAQQLEAAKYCYNRYVKILSDDDDLADEVAEFDDLVKEITAGRAKST